MRVQVMLALYITEDVDIRSSFKGLKMAESTVKKKVNKALKDAGIKAEVEINGSDEVER